MTTTYKLTITRVTQKRARNGQRPEPETLVMYSQELAQKDISRVVNLLLNPSQETDVYDEKPRVSP